MTGDGPTDGEVDGFTDLIEEFTVLCFVDGVQIRTDEFDTQTFQGPVVGKFAGDVQGRLTAHPRQQSARSLLLKNTGDGVGQQGLNVDDIGHFGVVLDGCRIGIDEDDLVAVFPQSTHRLGAGEIEFGCLTDFDGAATEHHDGLQIVATWHQTSPPR